ncbi:cupin domain-containing protein [Luteolibacter sp. LG18]|uniref:cupin domain-containing protein n=1 Tax=Luteolibacter sp. LG18 TaxID=2819286 RepID=UPI002B2F309D|nr:transcriptional regulator [Luteolibacter sp. LG18]
MNLVELASRIRNTRLSRGYTLDRVSELSGLGKGLLSKVENFRVTPSLPTLARLCEALGIRLSELVEGLDERPNLSIIRRGERKAVDRDSDQSDISYESLAHGRPDRKMDPFELTIPAGGGRRDPMPHEGEEFLTVLEGAVTFEFNGELHQLVKGDSAYFDADIAHRVFNPGATEARILCVFLGRSL